MRPAVSGVTDFFCRLAQRNSIRSKDEWDLLPGNRQAVKLMSRFPKFRIVFSGHDDEQGGGKALTKYYMLDLASQRTAPWNVAVKRASDALMICRLDPSFNEYPIPHLPTFQQYHPYPQHAPTIPAIPHPGF